jgi:HD-GYP domain-containing protein (c-di-GMP phosphodiesterase class II)
MTAQEALDHLRANSGKKYHPAAVQLFLIAKMGEHCRQKCRTLAHKVFTNKPAASYSNRIL